jgi:3-hydroxyisobutyrate dehydrogenase-like beta-hydroxyacid dehydrogenase
VKAPTAVAAPEERPPGAGLRWLVVGHGSVGSFLASRIVRSGAAVCVLDSNPRVPLARGVEQTSLAEPNGPFDCVVSCVPATAAPDVPIAVAGHLAPGGFFFDWNTTSPSAKARVADAIPAMVIDVALLDSLDANVELPHLAVSGRRVEDAAEVLRELGFRVSTVGGEVGEAAALKYLRSIFMKSLEALVLEHAALSAALDRDAIVRDSIASNVGPQFMEFMDLLVRTNRIHAERRSHELADAVAVFAEAGARPEIAAASVDLLRRAAQVWRDPAAPPPESDLINLAAYARSALWPPPSST